VRDARPRKNHRGVDLISDALPFGRLRYEQVPDAIDYAKFRSRSHNAVIRVYDGAGNVIETHEDTGDFKNVLMASYMIIFSRERPLDFRANFVYCAVVFVFALF
jgi:hypothetical protein